MGYRPCYCLNTPLSLGCCLPLLGLMPYLGDLGLLSSRVNTAIITQVPQNRRQGSNCVQNLGGSCHEAVSMCPALTSPRTRHCLRRIESSLCYRVCAPAKPFQFLLEKKKKNVNSVLTVTKQYHTLDIHRICDCVGRHPSIFTIETLPTWCKRAPPFRAR